MLTLVNGAESVLLPPDLRILQERDVQIIEQALNRAWPSGEVHLIIKNRRLHRIRTRKTEKVDSIH